MEKTPAFVFVTLVTSLEQGTDIFHWPPTVQQDPPSSLDGCFGFGLWAFSFSLSAVLRLWATMGSGSSVLEDEISKPVDASDLMSDAHAREVRMLWRHSPQG